MIAQLRWGERTCADMQHEAKAKHPLAVMQVSSAQHKKAKHTKRELPCLPDHILNAVDNTTLAIVSKNEHEETQSQEDSKQTGRRMRPHVGFTSC